MHCVCISAVFVDSILRVEKRNYPQVYLEQCKYKIKKRELVNFIDDEVNLSDDNSDDEVNLTDDNSDDDNLNA